ncbi:MAG TPA: hypothetical protein PK587_02015 [Syntrophales bacterium]|nr:hypothetical protein [Syntrophales bacterium]
MIFLFHAGLMILSFFCAAAAIAVVLFLRRKRWWLGVHRFLGFTAGGLAAAGFVAAWWMVSSGHGGGHFHVPHAQIGLLTSLLIMTTPLTGMMQLRVRRLTPVLRRIHVILGRISILLMAVTVLMGLLTAELL